MNIKFRLLALPLALTVTACGDDEEKGGPEITVRIGTAIDLTGSSATPEFQRAIELAMQHVNAGLLKSDKFSHMKFELGPMVDTQGDDVLAAERATDLVAQGAKALILQSSSEVRSVNRWPYDNDPSNDLNVPSVCGLCSTARQNNPTVTHSDPVRQGAERDPDEWSFRTTMSNAADSSVIARMITAINGGDINNDGKVKVSVYTNSAGGGFRAELKTRLQEVDPNVIYEDAVQFDESIAIDQYPGWNSDMAKLVDNYNENTQQTDGFPDAIMEGSNAQIAARILQAYHDNGTSIKFYHENRFRNPAVLELAGALAEGAEGSSAVVYEDNASGQHFASQFRASTGGEPVLGASSFYDAGMVMMLATLKAIAANGHLENPNNVTGPEIRAALYEINNKAAADTMVRTGAAEMTKAADRLASGAEIDYDGAVGPCDFDQYGNVYLRLARWMVEGGAFVDKQYYNCVSEFPACP